MKHMETKEPIIIGPKDLDFSPEIGENSESETQEMNELIKAFAGAEITSESRNKKLAQPSELTLKTELTGHGTHADYTGPIHAILRERKFMKRFSKGTMDILPLITKKSVPSIGRMAEIIYDNPTDTAPYSPEQIDLTAAEKAKFVAEMDTHMDLAREIIDNPALLDSKEIDGADIAGLVASICYLKIKAVTEQA